jgi:hypothetical protein
VTRPVRRRAPQPTRIRAFELLASCRDGCTQALLLAHGFTLPQLAELVRAGLATAQVECWQPGALWKSPWSGLGDRR